MTGVQCTTVVSKFIHPITIKAAVEVASNLRSDDRREVEEGHGLDPLVSLVLEAKEGSSVYFTVPNGKTAGMAGVGEGGLIWMLTTPAIHDYPLTFARESKRFVDSRTEPLLWNIVDELSLIHISEPTRPY